MSNPQQPELRRSERNPALSPDAMEGKLEAREHELQNALDHQPVDADVTSHEVSSTKDEDQPDPDDFAEAFGTRPKP